MLAAKHEADPQTGHGKDQDEGAAQLLQREWKRGEGDVCCSFSAVLTSLDYYVIEWRMMGIMTDHNINNDHLSSPAPNDS